MITKPKHGERNNSRHRLGEWHGQVKHPDSLVRQVVADYQSGRFASYEALAAHYGLNRNTVADWCQFKTRYTAHA